jgi:hypothetical protein
MAEKGDEKPEMKAKALTFADKMFGEGGFEVFKELAMAAMEKERIKGDIEEQGKENAVMREQHKTYKKLLAELQKTMEANLEDRERVINYQREQVGCGGCGFFSAAVSGALVSLTPVLPRPPRPFLLQIHQLLEEKTLLEQDRDNLITSNVLKIEEIKMRNVRDNKSLTDRVAFLNEELVELLSFKNEKKRLNETVARLENEKSEMQVIYQRKTRDLEQRMIAEHDRMKKEKMDEIESCRAEMQSLMETKLDTTTKRTIEENGEMSMELRFQSHCTEKLLKENRRLQKNMSKKVCDMEILESMQNQMSQKIRFYEKLFKKIQQKELDDLLHQVHTCPARF